MPPENSKIHYIPTDPDSQQKQHAEITVTNITAPSGSTTTALPNGLHAGLGDAYRWAEQFHLTEELLRVIGTCLIWQKPDALGSILAQITSPDSLLLLEEWKNTDLAALLLYNLAVVAKKNSPLLTRYPPPPKGKSAKQQLKGEIPTHYLLAMISERPPTFASESEKAWFAKLRLWVLTHAINRSFYEIYQDNYIRSVADRLRMACDNDQNWRDIFLLVRSGTEPQTFYTLNRYIIDGAKRVLDDKSLSKNSYSTLLSNLVSVAKSHQNKDTSPKASSNPPFSIKDGYPSQEKRDYNPVLDNILEDEDIALTVNDLEDDQDADDNMYAQIGVNEDHSYDHQRLEAGKIFLLAAEELQFLPWAWGKPNKFEMAELSKWVEQSLSSNEQHEKVTAVMTWVAMHTAYSLRQALDIKFSSEVDRDWAIDPNSVTLHRRPPQRLPGWYPKNQEHIKWVNPIAERFTFSIPGIIKNILKKHIASNPSTKQLGDLWNSKWGKNPEERFRIEARKSFPRITPGMLGGVLPQKTFKESGDPILTRLLTSHPNSVLSGACSYPGWNFDQLNPILSKAVPDISWLTKPNGLSNVLGSQLDPVESLLLEAIRIAGTTIKRLAQQNEPIAFHNAYTAYVSVMLLAATGGRPIRDPFEKLTHFDFMESFVFIDDKSSTEIHRGRLVILPLEVSKYIQQNYLRHLEDFAHAIQNVNAGLADDIFTLILGKSDAKIPFLFFVKVDASDWESISEKSIKDTELFGWPLPLNLFRNRLSRKLRHQGADPEVVDTILGHVDGATPTHGDFSFRVWLDDMQAVRPLMDKLFSDLGFDMMPSWHGNSLYRSDLGKREQSSHSAENSIFGAAARKAERTRSRLLALLEAESQIKAYLEEHSLSELSELNEDGVHELMNQLLFQKCGMRHPRGHIKYQCLITKLERLWEEEGKKVRIKKRYFAMQEEASCFTEEAPNAMGIYRELKAKLAEITPLLIKTKLSHKVAASTALVYLSIENRINSNQLITDVLHRKNFRLVTLGGEAFLEHSEYMLYKKHDVPVQRYLLSGDSAYFLDIVLGAKISHPFEDHPIPEPLRSIADILIRRKKISANSLTLEFFNSLAKLVNQVNLISYPGIVAGFLSGRVETFSLMWNDLARMRLGYAIAIPKNNVETDESYEVSTAAELGDAVVAFKGTKNENLGLQQGAQSLIKHIDDLLAKYASQNSGRYAAKDREAIRRLMLEIIDNHIGRISSCIQLLALWVCSLVHRKAKDGFIVIDSIRRYLSALKKPFEDVGFALDLVSLDEDGITVFYSDLMDSLEVNNSSYVLERLSDFHRWANRNYDIENPDWTDLPPTFSTARALPGIITEAEYLLALRNLMNQPIENPHDKVAPAFLILLCYRFGLRSQEATGLLREDWQTYEGLIVVSVHNNILRDLKNPTSRRQVPLLFSLSKLEMEIIDQWMFLVEAVSGDDMSEGIFFKDRKSYQPRAINRITSKAIWYLKTATQNPQMTLHHARHSAANKVGLSICGLNTDNWDKLSDNCSFASNTIQDRLLGSSGPTRRKVWALSRYLGHVRKVTTVRNYLHFISEIADSTMQPVSDVLHGELIHAISLEDFPLQPNSPLELKDTFTPVKQTLHLMLEYFRMLSRGKPFYDAAIKLGVNEILSHNCNESLSKLDQKIKLSSTILTKAQGGKSPLEFLRRITWSAWSRLMKLAKELDVSLELATISRPHVTLYELSEMIGPTRQLLMWEQKHFELAKFILATFNIDDSRYRVVHSDQADERILALATSCGFRSISQSKAWVLLQQKKKTKKKNGKPNAGESEENRYKLDTAVTGENRNRVEKRCALIIFENDQYSIHNSIEFIVMLLALSLATLQYE